MEKQYLFSFANPYKMLVLTRLSECKRRYGFSEIDEPMVPAKELNAFLLCLRSWINL